MLTLVFMPISKHQRSPVSTFLFEGYAQSVCLPQPAILTPASHTALACTARPAIRVERKAIVSTEELGVNGVSGEVDDWVCSERGIQKCDS